MSNQFELAPERRCRCFGPTEDRKAPCPLIARWRAIDHRRHDSITFFCDQHKPADAVLIREDQTFVELGIPGLVVMGASTLRHADAKLEALFAVTHALGKLGANFTPADVRAVLKTGRLIVPARHS